MGGESMLIINQWATSGAEYITDDLKVKREVVDDIPMSCLYVNGLCFAMNESDSLIKNLQQKLYGFIDTHRRTTDTFDIAVELDKLNKLGVS